MTSAPSWRARSGARRTSSSKRSASTSAARPRIFSSPRSPCSGSRRGCPAASWSSAGEIVWRSPILLTPFLPDGTIDAHALGEFIARCYRDAGVAHERHRQRRGDPHRRGDQAQERARHRRAVRRRGRQVRLRHRRPHARMPAGRARLGRGGAVARHATPASCMSTSAAAPPSWR